MVVMMAKMYTLYKANNKIYNKTYNSVARLNYDNKETCWNFRK